MTTTAHDEIYQSRRRALLLLLGAACPAEVAAESVTIIFANESWYRERPEREQEFTGILRKASPPEGPNARSALKYSFQTEGRSLAVYAPGSEEKFNRLSGARVNAVGKLVDLTRDGFGLELWIASIRHG